MTSKWLYGPVPQAAPTGPIFIAAFSLDSIVYVGTSLVVNRNTIP
jgi:hypothetical protein